MRTVRRSRRLSAHTLPDSLDQCVPGGFDYLDIDCPKPCIVYPVAATVSYDAPLSPQAIESLSAFADQRELPPPDLHSQCRRRKGKNGNAPRPPNAFMLFRSDFWKFNKDTIPERDHRQISRIAAHCWNALAEPRRVPYQERARKLKEEHALLYPQHKYNSSTKEKARKKAKGEVDDDEMCDVLSAQVAQDVRASQSPEISGSSESVLLDQVIERKVNLKRPRSAFVKEEAFKSESQPPAKKRKRNLRNLPAGSAQASEVQSQPGISHSTFPSFVPTNEIPALTLPPSRGSPTVKKEPLQDPFLEISAHNITIKTEPDWPSPPVVDSPKMEASELEVPEVSALSSPQFSFEPPIQYVEKAEETVVDKGLRFFESYGIVGFFEGLDLSIFDNFGDESASMGTPEENDELSQWCNPC